MMRHARVLVLLALAAWPVEAGPLRLFRPRARPATSWAGSSLTALESATLSAQAGVLAHRGGSYAFEGVGFSTASADDAIRNCCYYGTREIVESAVVRGDRGWYACVRYR